MITGSRWIRCVRGLKCSWRLSEFDVGRLELRINARAVAHHATGVFACSSPWAYCGSCTIRSRGRRSRRSRRRGNVSRVALLMLSHGPGEGRCRRCECLAGGGGSVITGKPDFTPTRVGFPIRRVRKRLRRLTWAFPYGSELAEIAALYPAIQRQGSTAETPELELILERI